MARNPYLYGLCGLLAFGLCVLSPHVGAGPLVMWGVWGYEVFWKRKPKTPEGQ